MASPVSVGNYDSLDFNSPMTDLTANALVAELAATQPSEITDVGCGWGEFLIRLAASCPEATAQGIDHDEVLLDRARQNVEARSLRERVSFHADLSGVEPSDVVVCIGSEHVFGSLSDALSELHQLVRPGGRLMFGRCAGSKHPRPI